VAAASRLGRQLEEVNLLTDSEKAEDIDRVLIALGYHCLHRSADAGNYLRGDERVDFIYASRPAARGLLSNVTTVQTAFGEVRVVSTEGLIGLKLQGFVNNPRRTQDLEDIKALVAANRQALKMDEVREYLPAATSRDPFEALDDLMTVIEALCPVWPNRAIFSSTDRFLI
jgi:hypothetical protein